MSKLSCRHLKVISENVPANFGARQSPIDEKWEQFAKENNLTPTT